ncbi:unnamed protein product [Linum trigynum]|uniref:Uncharacterized protein n=1 Tax=Linum trigynum TaxID=586398 RepID=A0AAV2GW82_9ROSI
MEGKWSKVWLIAAVAALLVVAASSQRDGDNKPDVGSRLGSDFGSATLDDVIPADVLTGGFSGSPSGAPASAPTARDDGTPSPSPSS